LRPLWRLTREQYDNTIRDLLGIEGHPSLGLAADEKLAAFFSNTISPASRSSVEQGRAMKPVQRWFANRSLSRRALLRGLGASAALSPFLPRLEAQGQRAQPLRLILWFTPHGTVYDNWKPSGGHQRFGAS
jgi:hypothetical protein